MGNLKNVRESRGLTQAKLAEISSVNVRIIQHYEQGFRDINKAMVKTVYRLAKALGCRIEDLIEKDGQE